MPAGVDYSEELALEVCKRVEQGRSLNSVCGDPDMPVRSTFYEWMSAHSWLSDKYARAREKRAEFLAEEIIDIADTETDSAKARNRIDARKWAASKLDPKRYGDKLTLDGDLKVKMPDDQLESRLAFLLGKTRASSPPRGEGETEGSA